MLRLPVRQLAEEPEARLDPLSGRHGRLAAEREKLDRRARVVVGHQKQPVGGTGAQKRCGLLRPRWTSILDILKKTLEKEILPAVRKLQLDGEGRTVIGDLRHDLIAGF